MDGWIDRWGIHTYTLIYTTHTWWGWQLVKIVLYARWISFRYLVPFLHRIVFVFSFFRFFLFRFQSNALCVNGCDSFFFFIPFPFHCTRCQIKLCPFCISVGVVHYVGYSLSLWLLLLLLLVWLRRKKKILIILIISLIFQTENSTIHNGKNNYSRCVCGHHRMDIIITSLNLVAVNVKKSKSKDYQWLTI